jgi:hypothetical protein
MEPGQQVAIWLHDKAAKLFLGLNEKHPVSRWIAIGEVVDRPNAPIGVWVDVTYVEERRPSTKGKVKRVRYGVKPGQCLIRWDYMITL